VFFEDPPGDRPVSKTKALVAFLPGDRLPHFFASERKISLSRGMQCLA